MPLTATDRATLARTPPLPPRLTPEELAARRLLVLNAVPEPWTRGSELAATLGVDTSAVTRVLLRARAGEVDRKLGAGAVWWFRLPPVPGIDAYNGPFNDFDVDGVYFDHRPSQAGDATLAFYKVWWHAPGANKQGAGRLILDRTEGWCGFDEHYVAQFRGAPSKLAAVRRLVTRRWDP